MGTCKGCNNVYGVLELRNGYCNNCVPFETTEVEWEKQQLQEAENRKVEAINAKAQLKRVIVSILFTVITSIIIGSFWSIEAAVTFVAGMAFFITRFIKFG